VPDGESATLTMAATEKLCRFRNIPKWEPVASTPDLLREWRATVDEDGHYSFAVPL
jgi:hypothetical protein